MPNAKMFKALNEQITFEYYSSYMYLSMSAFFADLGLPGCSHWMRLQADEELLHAHKFFDFLLNRGEKVILQGIETPPNTWKDALDAFQATLKHEQLVTSRINALVELAFTSKDYASHTFLQWFISEQVEEESTVTNIISQLKLIKGDGHGLLLIDRDLGLRQAGTTTDTPA
ncbi:MAG: ferritin [Desulfovibrio sp.]|jgi:ferritin|nr:ferritin [Desulfovibrio sp.]